MEAKLARSGACDVSMVIVWASKVNFRKKNYLDAKLFINLKQQMLTFPLHLDPNYYFIVQDFS